MLNIKHCSTKKIMIAICWCIDSNEKQAFEFHFLFQATLLGYGWTKNKEENRKYEDINKILRLFNPTVWLYSVQSTVAGAGISSHPTASTVCKSTFCTRCTIIEMKLLRPGRTGEKSFVGSWWWLAGRARLNRFWRLKKKEVESRRG